MDWSQSPLSSLMEGFRTGQKEAAQLEGMKLENTQRRMQIAKEQQQARSQAEYLKQSIPIEEATSQSLQAMAADPNMNPDMLTLKTSQAEVGQFSKLMEISAKTNNWDAYKENQQGMIQALTRFQIAQSSMVKGEAAKIKNVVGMLSPYLDSPTPTPAMNDQYMKDRALIASQLPPDLASQLPMSLSEPGAMGTLSRLASMGMTAGQTLTHQDRQNTQKFAEFKFGATMQERKREFDERMALMKARLAQQAHAGGGQWKGDVQHAQLVRDASAPPNRLDLLALKKKFTNMGYGDTDASSMAAVAAYGVSKAAAEDLQAYEEDPKGAKIRSREERLNDAALEAADEYGDPSDKGMLDKLLGGLGVAHESTPHIAPRTMAGQGGGSAAATEKPAAKPAPAKAPALKAPPADVLAQAKAAIAAGKDPEAIKERLKEHGYSDAGL